MSRATLRVVAPADMEPLDIAQAVVGPQWLLKAERTGPKGSDRTFQDYAAMRELSKRWQDAYRKQLEKIIQLVRKYVEEHIILGPLGKAGPKKPLVTPRQLGELRRIIEDYHQAFIVGTVGPDAITPGEAQRLIDVGVLPQDLAYTFQPGAKELPPEAMTAINHAYRYGHVLAAARNLTDKRRRGIDMTYEQFVEDYAPRMPLTDDEQHAIDWLKHSAATEIRGLGNKVADDFSTIAIEADASLRRQYVGLIRETMEENVQRRETWRELASNLGHKSGDWARDFGRIAATEKQKAMQEGLVTGLVQRHGDPRDINVAKQPNNDACRKCLELHLEGGVPRIFKLSELIANGTNVGKKQAAWSPVVGPVHPFCLISGSIIDTRAGPKPIEAVVVGDEVITHKARFRRVTATAQRWYEGELVVLRAGGKTIKATPEHRFMCDGEQWRSAAYIFPGRTLLRSPLIDSVREVTYLEELIEGRTIEPFKGVVYNFAVEGDESYLVEGFVSHNCGCELIHVPDGMAFNDAGNLVPEHLTRADYLERDLLKALPKEPPKAKHLTYENATPEHLVIRVGDPQVRAEIEKVVAATPPELFDRKVGVTLITTDIPRVQNPLEEHDYAYWTGNEIRLSQTLPWQMIGRVLRHELGHATNVHMMHRLGGTEPVRAWHKKLWKISQEEGFVSDYAKKMPIENHAEIAMLYLYERQRLMIRWPRQFAFLHRALRDVWRKS